MCTIPNVYLIPLQLHLQYQCLFTDMFNSLIVFLIYFISICLGDRVVSFLLSCRSFLCLVSCLIWFLYIVSAVLFCFFILVFVPSCFPVTCSFFSAPVVSKFSLLFYSILTFLLFAAFLVSQYQVQ